MCIIKLTDVFKTYNAESVNPVYALRGVNLEIQKGSFTAITGPSGSGKSTLLNIIGLMDNMTKGNYFLEGMDISVLRQSEPAKLRNSRFGFVLQDFGLLFDRTVEENIMIPLLFAGIPFFKCRKRIVEMLERMGIPELLNRPAGELSGGQKQRTAIARALINEPSVLLADEPTGALDSEMSQEIINIFRELNQSGMTVLIVTHEKEIAVKCHEIVHLKDGVICAN